LLMSKKLLKIPGLIDAHVHLRDPGSVSKEDFYTGTCAALAGGVTAILDMPNNPNPIVNQKTLKEKIKIGKAKAVCDYGLYFGADQESFAEHSKVIERVCGLKIYLDSTHGPLLVRDLLTLMNHFKNWPLGKPICVHAEDMSVAVVLGLVATYKKPVHFCHVSQASEISLIQTAKEQGLPITCEVAPHHLFLTQKDEVSLGACGRMKPTLKTKHDQKALWQAINRGVVDMVGSDHASHTRKEKESQDPPFGVPGLETTLPLLLTAVNKKRLTVDKLIELTSTNPAKIFGLNLKKSPSFVIVDLNQRWEIPQSGFQTKCDWSPFAGFQAQGKVKEVWMRGKKAWDGEKVLVEPGFGQNLF